MSEPHRLGRLHRILLCLAVCGCAAQPTRPPTTLPAEPPRAANEGPTRTGQRDLEVLASFISGNWDAKPGETPMRMRVAELWPGGTVRWFYLEWVAMSDDSRPTRQLIFRVAEDGEDRMTTTVHRLPQPGRFAGEWRRAKPFASIGPGDLTMVPGCRLLTQRTLTAHFIAVTEGNSCPGDLPGVPYMRFEFSIASSEMTLLEQPRDAAGKVPEDSRLTPFQLGRESRQPR